MTRSIQIMTANYANIRLRETDAGKLRGFFADLDTGDSNLHNHTQDGADLYRYPRIQYKILEGTPVIVAVDEGINSIYPHLLQLNGLKIGSTTYPDPRLQVSTSGQRLGDTDEVWTYQFLTPWLALNQTNYIRYTEADEDERRQLLSRILIGNLLSLCKGFGVTVERPLEVGHSLKSRAVVYKGTKMEGFMGSFQVNCAVPDLLGIGKGVAVGFGTVKAISKTQK